jgi:ribonuclease R
MPTIDKEQIYNFLKTRTSRPVSIREISKALNIDKTEARSLKRILRILLRTGDIYRTKSGFYGPVDKLNLISGTFDAHRDGYGFVIPDKSAGKDLFIPPGKTLGAMTGDRVVARIDSPARMEGSIKKILERGQQKIIGELCREKNIYFVKPKGKKTAFYIVVTPEHLGGAQEGDMVVVDIISYPSAAAPPEGQILKVLPRVSGPGDETDMIIEEFGLPIRFPAAVLTEAASIKESGLPRKRTDCRGLLTVTIDGETAKDFDDAISIDKTDYCYVLYVHIADVSHYVPWNSVLDLEARKRGTSVYFPGSVIPMLPEKLSNDICSLVPGKDRLTFTVEMHFDRDGQIIKKDFYPSTILSNERMTYTSVKKILEDNDHQEKEKYAHLIESFENMDELSSLIRKHRTKRGSLDFDLPEPEILLDIQGRPESIVRAERNLAHMIIEDFMIAANEAVASFIEKLGLPSLYRIHEKPDTAKLDELRPVFSSLGLKVKKSGTKIFHSILKQVKGKPEETLLNILLLRSLKQAKYSTENAGHFGLASKSYSHFTSPIRRYPDLVVHRILKSALGNGRPSKKNLQFLDKLLPDIAVHSSNTERTAAEAEREILRAMKAWFMKERIGDEFTGIVTNITNQGLKIELRDIFIEGFLHVSSMSDDYYHFDEKNFRLVGRRGKKRFKLGQEVQVRIDRVDTAEREIVLGLV